MGEGYLRALKEANWGYESETSSFTHSDIRYPWEDEVNSQGELFYVLHYPFSKDLFETNQDISNCENTGDKTSAGILGRLMRRRSSRRSFRKKDDKGITKQTSELLSSPDDSSKPSTSKKEMFDSELEPVNIYMKIDFPNMKIIGRRATAVETFLGLKVVDYGNQIIINDVIPNSPAYYIQSAFRKGDWLHSINGILMTPENIENYLRNISFSKEVKEVVLTVQRVKPVSKCEPLVTSALNEQEDYEIEGFGILFIRLGRNSEGTSSEDIVFSYPSEGNVITPIRGAFLTLLHLLPSLGANQPISSTFIGKEQLVNVLYTKKDDGVLLLAMPDSRISLKEFRWVNAEVVRCLLFTFQSLSRCFSTERNINSLNKFFHALFKRVIHRQMDSSETQYEFESLLPCASSLLVSHEIYVQVDDALNELEANDVEGYEEQRLFNIVGSCYFYKGYNICSHLGKQDLIDIMSLCRQSDILGFMRGGVSDLVFWKEVFPASVNRGATNIHAPYSLLPASWFLLIVAKDHNFLFVLLESGGYTLRPLQKPGPDVSYVEEALATLKHIIKIGIPQVVNKLIKQNDDLPKPLLSNSSSFTEHSLLSSPLSEQLSLNKQHSLSYRSLDGSQLARSRSNINVIAPSGYDSLSSDDCAPVIGRRAERELVMETLSRVSDISDDSDWNKEFKSSNRGHNSESQDMELTIPPKLMAGKKDVMLHYVHLDKVSGILISSVNNSKEYSSILNNFRLNAHKIHKILMNTISFKKLKAQEVSSCTINKSMIAIKEHGILFECDLKKPEVQSYWVVGRIFFTPHLKEVYLCYQDTCPQNLIEVAFRLALSCPL